ncbi:hypothetical protein ACFQVD_26415 [Streptosporangium amethystogenes subsp. fukuiense]|uniref:Minor tail protein n=1 Tax=Streptosporangium amethystogenes subsp. fukuiense TaxID=698418 RepID=A0ABW2T5F0_9ACTN
MDPATSINGFRFVTEVGTGRFITRVWRRVAAAGEPDSYLGSQPSGAEGGTVIVVAVSGAHRTLPLVYATTDDSDEGVTPPVAPSTASSLEIRVASGDISGPTTWSAPPGYTMRAQASSGVIVSTGVATRQVNSSASSGAQTFGFNRPLLAWHGITLSVPSAEVAPPVEPPPPFTPGVGSALYRYVFSRLMDGAYLGDLDLENVTFDKRILQPGTFSATIPIPSREVGDQVAEIIPRGETVLDRGPGVITCQVYRAGEPWGEYWITAATISRSGRDTPSIQLRGSTLDAYLLHVELQEELGPFEGLDQIDIARELLYHAQGQPYADLGLVLQGGTSGTVRDRTYTADEATYGQRLTELAQVEGGFEWAINIVAGPYGLERHWVWGMPLGTQSPAPHLFSDGPYSGEILSWGEEIDALRGATRWRARGDRISTDASTASTPLISTSAEALAHLAAGWPRIDKTVTHSTVTEMTTLEGYASYWAATAPGALRVDSVTVALGEKPSITMNSLGDAARLHYDNEWHLPHWRTRRIIGIGITPTSKAAGKEVAQLILEGQEAP